MEETVKTYKSSSPAGDLLSMLPSIRQIYRLTGKKAIIYQALNVIGQGFPPIPQAFTNKSGESILMGEQTFNNLVPLLRKQSYIEDIRIFEGQQVEYDLDEVRFKTFTNQANGSLHRVLWYAFPEMACDLSEKFLDVEPDELNVDYSEKIIINFTPRFRNNWTNYFFLRDHQDKLLFSGLEKERNEFCEKWGLDIPLLETNDFYELALIVNKCKFFMSNQTAFFQIAEGLKVKRILETCPQLPHVIPMGAEGKDFYHQGAVELYFNQWAK